MTSGRPRSADERDDETRALVEAERVAFMAAAEALPTARDDNREPVEMSVVRRTRAVALRIAGLDWDKCAQQAGYNTIDACKRAVKAAIAAHEAETVAELRDLENARLDRQQAAIWPQVVSGQIGAGRLALQISERRSRLNGLDKPVDVALTPGSAEITAWVTAVVRSNGQPDLAAIEANVIDVMDGRADDDTEDEG